jgi:2-iminobutanoate/2-iminopropanoate deaminase
MPRFKNQSVKLDPATAQSQRWQSAQRWRVLAPGRHASLQSINPADGAGMIEYPVANSTPRSHLPFSPCTKVGSLIFVSGQASVDSTGTIVSDTFEGEMRRSIYNLQMILEAAGSGLKHVVQTRNYVHDPANLSLFNQIYRELFIEPYPARTTITQCLTEALKFEIECVAVIK